MQLTLLGILHVHGWLLMWRACWVRYPSSKMCQDALSNGIWLIWINHKTLAIIETSEVLESEPYWLFWSNRWNQELEVQKSEPFGFIGIRWCAVFLFLYLHVVMLQGLWNLGSEAEKWTNVSIPRARKVKFKVGQHESVWWKFLSWVNCREKKVNRWWTGEHESLKVGSGPLLRGPPLATSDRTKGAEGSCARNVQKMADWARVLANNS